MRRRRSSWIVVGLVALLAGAPALGCGAGGPGVVDIPTDARTTIVSLVGLRRSEDLVVPARIVARMPGVYRMEFDKRRVELTVIADPSVDVVAQLRAADVAGAVVLEPGAGKGSYAPWAITPEGADVREVAKDGEDVADLAPHLARGKVTVVDFSARWCEPCRAMDAHVLRLMAKRDDVAYRKLDVGDWDTPLARRYLSHAKQIPHVWIFDKRGQRVGEVNGLDVDAVDALVDLAASD